MPVSSSSLFHFTSSLDKFKSILTHGFRVGISLEVDPYNTTRSNHSIMAVPMICFCDIPISLVESHTQMYSPKGVFSIGLKRNWAYETNCHPVLYSNLESPFKDCFDSLNILIREYLKTTADQEYNRNCILNDFFETQSITFRDLNGRNYRSKAELFTKPLRGDYYYGRDSMSEEPKCMDYNFYNEREWRYLPNDLEPLPFFTDRDKAFSQQLLDIPRNQIEQQKLLAKEYEIFQGRVNELRSKVYPYLTFTPDNISHLIVQSDEMVIEIVDFLTKRDPPKTIGGLSTFTEEQVKLLTTKLISYEDIKSNF